MRNLSRSIVRLALAVGILLAGALTATPALAATTIEVNTASDVTPADDGVCTLREAIASADTDTASGPTVGECLAGDGADTIRFANSLGTATIAASSPLPAVTDSAGLVIDGGNDITVDGGDTTSLFNVSGLLEVKDIKVTNGQNSGSDGGAFHIGAGGNLIVTRSTVSSSTADNGGAIYNGGALSVEASTFTGNVAGTSGGAVYLDDDTSTTITNSTFADNSAGSEGGAVLIYSTLAYIYNSTIAGNESSSDTGAGFQINSGALWMYNSIVANSITGDDCGNSLSSLNGNNNLIEDTGNCGYTAGVDGNIVGVDPELFPLGTYGFATQTMALASSSPAVDAGDNGTCIVSDQRYVPRPQGANCDMGAFEVELLTVTKTADTNDGTCDTDCSLREAMTAATPGALIDFSVGGTFPLGSELPTIFKILTIDGSGQAVTLDGQDSVRIFRVWVGGYLTGLHLTLSNGYGASPSGGAALYLAFGTATFQDTTFTGNTSGDGIVEYAYGGAIENEGTLNLNRSTFSDNHAVTPGSTTGYGGAIYSQGALTITNSTLVGNSADFGGAIFSYNSSLTMSNGTIARNTANTEGGGLYNDGTTTVSLKNSILADSLSGNDCFSSFGATMSEDVNNLIENSVDCGTPVSSSDPMLNGLDDNGGFTLTMALMAGSPAINAGDDTVCAADPVSGLDQRGITRPQGAHCDIGAYERGTGLFQDVPVPGKEWMEPWIEAFYYAGVTTGCGSNPLIYCPENQVTRAEMAVFLLRAKHGSGYVPPAPTHDFADVPVTGKEWMEPWIEQFYEEGITTGCGGGNYCPENNVTRAEMAVFVLRALHGGSYAPPAGSGVFADVPVSGKEWMEPWIIQFYNEGITTGCGGGNYCPENNVTRAEMAVFIDRAYSLYP